ncbi:hypothetical protein [Methylophaga sp.]|uniref:hypothetical protein n=1 Tax=Methylophaga sp. TaxID=2024840 RepID=UPI003F69B6C3
MNDPLSREDIEFLLPFYVNGSLESDEKEQVEQALENNPSLREEIVFLRKLQQEVKTIPAANSPGEMGLKRLQQRIEPRKKNSRATQGWRLTAVAASFLLVVQTSVMMLSPGPDGYQQAGGGQTSQLLLVTFEPETTEVEIRQLLLQYRLSIVEGPSAIGIYKLSATTRPDAILDRLQQSDVIETVQLNQ